MKRKPGRPIKVDPDAKKISVDQAVQITWEYWAQFGIKGYSKQYIYNLMSDGKLRRDTRGKGALLFEDEVREKLCG